MEAPDHWGPRSVTHRPTARRHNSRGTPPLPISLSSWATQHKGTQDSGSQGLTVGSGTVLLNQASWGKISSPLLVQLPGLSPLQRD